MRAPSSYPPYRRRHRHAWRIALGLLSACSTVSNIKGPEDGASTETGARAYRARRSAGAADASRLDLGARDAAAASFSTREQLRANFLQIEAGDAGSRRKKCRRSRRPTTIRRESVLATINDDPSYCNKERTDAIRLDLNRYLAGDYSPNSAHGPLAHRFSGASFTGV